MNDATGREVVWSIVQDISQRKAMESELAAAALRDRLTGLANRSLFMERLQASIERVRSGQQQLFAVLFLDFDRFKLVNDAMGHEAGDELLKQIADRLRTALRSADARRSGIGQPDRAFRRRRVPGAHQRPACAAAMPRASHDRLLARSRRPYRINGRDVHSTASIGIVTSDQCLESAEAVVRNADVAMYEAKRAGRACSVIFNEAMHTRLARNLTIESSAAKSAGHATSSTLVYQPIIELETGRMTSVEALVRWQHPTLGAFAGRVHSGRRGIGPDRAARPMGAAGSLSQRSRYGANAIREARRSTSASTSRAPNSRSATGCSTRIQQTLAMRTCRRTACSWRSRSAK